MRCETVRPLLARLADGALAKVTGWRVGRHVLGCADCAGRLEEMQMMRDALRRALERQQAPPGLAQRIGAALDREAVAVPRVARRWGFVRPVGLVLGGALAGVALMLVVPGGGGRGGSGVQALIDGHVRAVMGDRLVDVVSSDRHTVKPWLSARLDVSPPVRDFAAEGFPLAGGRLDYVEGRRAAVLVYRSDKHVIDVFVWAVTEGVEAPRLVTRQGFNVVTWRRGGMGFAAVSDVEAGKLRDLVALVAGS